MKSIKLIAIVAIAAGALSLGACASKEEPVTRTNTAATSSYSK